MTQMSTHVTLKEHMDAKFKSKPTIELGKAAGDPGVVLGQPIHDDRETSES